MKILVVGKNNLMLWPQSVHRNFLRMGHTPCLFLFNKKTLGYCFYRLFGKKYRLKWLTQQFEKQILTFKPDLILFVSTFFVPLSFFEVAASYPHIIKAGWSGDRFAAKEKKKANLLNFLFCSDSGYLKKAKKFSCQSYFLPLCADENVCKKIDVSKRLPPFFAGVANPQRNKYIMACRTRCLLYGKGWDKRKMPQHEIHNHKIPLAKMYQFVSQTVAPINICFSPNIINGMNFRVFETGAMGQLILLNQTKDLSTCYRIGKEAVTYSTPESFNRLLTDIVKNPKKYEKIAKAGYQRTLKEHTYVKRLEQMLKKLEF